MVEIKGLFSKIVEHKKAVGEADRVRSFETKENQATQLITKLNAYC